MPIEVTLLRNLTPDQVTARIRAFSSSYRLDWRNWTNALTHGLESASTMQLFEDVLKKWNSCRKRGGVRQGLALLINNANGPLTELGNTDLRALRRPSDCQRAAIRHLWDLIQPCLCLTKPASEVGISKAIMLLTRGRIGPALDESVRTEFNLPRIDDAGTLLAVYGAIAEDLAGFEDEHGQIDKCFPAEWNGAIPAIGRIVDMIAGPR
jgi:hypothetical protein